MINVVFRGSDRPHVSRDCHVSRKCGGISILRIPKAVSFSILPFSMVLVIIRTVQECIRLSKEEEKALGLR